VLKIRVLCYKCNRNGYLRCGWVESSYRPKHKYSGLYGLNPKTNRVSYDRYGIFYIRHYSPEVYQKQMEKYRSHQLKSRPNGQKRCYIQADLRFRWDEENKVGYAYMLNDSYWRSEYEGRVLERAKRTLPKIYESTRPIPLEFTPSDLFVD
jgi:hypothetical protein